jgi:predicted AlkP superfamily pyrophosphatase or phosphodiesterase
MQNAVRTAGALALAWSALFFSALARQEAPPIPPPAGAAPGGWGGEALAYAEGVPGDGGAPGFSSGPKARKVLILGMDGVRADAFLAAAAPHLHRLAREGSFARGALADRITRSGPGWTAILTGAWSPGHGVVDNTFEGYRHADHPHIFRRLKEALPDLATASVSAWEPIHGSLLTHADHSAAFAHDDSVAQEAVRLLSGGAGTDPDVLFLHFDAPDYAGHRYGFSRYSPPYMAALRKTDARVGRVLEALEKRSGRAREEWLILAVTDHGGTLRHHGEDVPACRRVPLIMGGDAAVPGLELADAALVDVAPTIMAFLGVVPGKGWKLSGRALPLLGGAVGDRLTRQLPDLLDEQVR